VAEDGARVKWNQVSGWAILLGYFALFCSLLLFDAAGWRAWKAAQVRSKWLPEIARVESCSLRHLQPLPDPDGSSDSRTLYCLECTLDYRVRGVAYHTVVTTTGTPSLKVRDEIAEWAARQEPGTELRIRVNPSAPKELLVQDALPIHQRPTAGDAIPAAVAFGVLGAFLIAAGRFAQKRLADCGGRVSDSL
jgi:hypothetical protein